MPLISSKTPISIFIEKKPSEHKKITRYYSVDTFLGWEECFSYCYQYLFWYLHLTTVFRKLIVFLDSYTDKYLRMSEGYRLGRKSAKDKSTPIR